MANVPGNEFPSKNYLCSLYPGEEQFQINLRQHHPRGYLGSGLQEFSTTAPLSWPQECTCLSHFPSAMWGTSLPYIHSCKLSKSCHFLWAKGGKQLRDGMYRITYYVLCHYILPAFLRHKPFNTLFIFFLSRICPKFDMCRKCLFNLPSFSILLGHSNMW